MNRHPLSKITEQDIEDYNRDGVVCLRQLFDTEWVERMHDASLKLMESGAGRQRVQVNEGETSKFYSNVFMNAYDDDFMAYRNDSPVAEIGATLMQSNLARFWYDQIFIKEPGTSAVTQWHHDLPFWPLRGNDIVSIWLALTPAKKETSGLEYLAGSHKWGKFYRATTPDEDPAFTDYDLEPCPDFSEHYDDPDLKFVSWDMEPGDCVCHHPLTVHGASGNALSTERRIGLSLRFIGDDAKWDPRPYTMKLGNEPKVAAGEYPADDDVFPIVWQKS